MRRTELCFSHSPGLHTFVCKAGAPAASPRPGALLRPPALLRYPQPQNSLELFATCHLSKPAWVSGQVSSLDQPPPARGLKQTICDAPSHPCRMPWPRSTQALGWETATLAFARPLGINAPELPRPLGAQDGTGLLESRTWLCPRWSLQHLPSSQPDDRSKPRPAQVRTTGDPTVMAPLPQVIRCLPGSTLTAFLP